MIRRGIAGPSRAPADGYTWEATGQAGRRGRTWLPVFDASRSDGAQTVAELIEDNLKVGEEFVGDGTCNCHGSRFDVDGAVLDGPAGRPLKQISAEDG